MSFQDEVLGPDEASDKHNSGKWQLEVFSRILWSFSKAETPNCIIYGLHVHYTIHGDYKI